MPATRRTRHVVAASALTLALVSSLTGCSTGFSAATGLQAASGNGANTNLGDLQIRDITIVKVDGSPQGTLIGTIVNRGTEDDALTGVTLVEPTGKATIGGTAAVAGTLPLKTSTYTRIGYNAEDHVDITGLEASPTQYVTVELQFQRAGTVRMDVMAVPPTGIYEGIAPLGLS
ncbi:hypothetical protein [Longivirga aurantiaca]|uniref:Secreted protein n=1 Tax=Longivirga aurantiaca TaxID=1837743 RepID=A0ABW1SX08_9ACTN